MPIPPELRHFYGPEWRNVIRPRILERAGHQCENCGKPNHAEIRTKTGKGRMFWRPLKSLTWRNEEGWVLTPEELALAINLPTRVIRVVIVPAHLNHTPGDDRDENLRAMCQWCHLRHDRGQHRQTFIRHRDDKRTLLLELAS